MPLFSEELPPDGPRKMTVSGAENSDPDSSSRRRRSLEETDAPSDEGWNVKNIENLENFASGIYSADCKENKMP